MGVQGQSTSAASEDPKTAAAVCVKGAPIVSTFPPFCNAFHARRDTTAPQVFCFFKEKKDIHYLN